MGYGYLLELNLLQCVETKMRVLYTPASLMHLHINALSAAQGIMGCSGKRRTVSLYPSLDYF